MSWLAIVFWIITNAPALITDIEKIIALIHTLPIGQRTAVQSQIAAAIPQGASAVQTVLTQVSGRGGP